MLVLGGSIRRVALKNKICGYLQSLSFPTGTVPSEAELEVTGLLQYRARSAFQVSSNKRLLRALREGKALDPLGQQVQM